MQIFSADNLWQLDPSRAAVDFNLYSVFCNECVLMSTDQDSYVYRSRQHRTGEQKQYVSDSDT